MEFMEQLISNLEPGKDYVSKPPEATPAADVPVRVIAYYLPQFHSIPENDLWWGSGFTEWTNVTKAVPRFRGHYQPQLPIHYGFYDLRNPKIMSLQADLARRGGVYGFCFHYYWFSGRRLLEWPLQHLMASPEIDLPFCINWANESWTRRWDGQEKQILIEQRYSQDDDLAFALALRPLLDDRRYIRVNGRPLIMIYRPSLLPDAVQTVERWRECLVKQGHENPYFVMPQGWDDADPRKYGMDAAAGFPPHLPPDIAEMQRSFPKTQVSKFDPSFRGLVYPFEQMTELALSNRPKDYTYFPGVCPGWDNDARRPGRGFTVTGSTPAKYGCWLSSACAQALEIQEPEERIVFVNAWNEWGEGAHLEPDRHFGYAYLSETNRVLNSFLASSKRDEYVSTGRFTDVGPSRRRGFNMGIKPKVADVLEALAERLR